MSDGGLTEKILTQVAEAKGVSKAKLPPLYEAIDIDSLESLCAHANDRPETDVTVQFTYVEYTITVTPSGTVTIEQ